MANLEELLQVVFQGMAILGKGEEKIFEEVTEKSCCAHLAGFDLLSRSSLEAMTRTEIKLKRVGLFVDKPGTQCINR